MTTLKFAWCHDHEATSRGERHACRYVLDRHLWRRIAPEAAAKNRDATTRDRAERIHGGHCRPGGPSFESHGRVTSYNFAPDTRPSTFWRGLLSEGQVLSSSTFQYR